MKYLQIGVSHTNVKKHFPYFNPVAELEGLFLHSLNGQRDRHCGPYHVIVVYHVTIVYFKIIIIIYILYM